MHHARLHSGRLHAVIGSILLIIIFLLTACVPPAQPATPTAEMPTQASTVQSAMEPPKPTQTRQIAATQTDLPAYTPQSAFPLSGTWTGSAKNGDYEMQVTIILQPGCQVGEVCGTYDLSLPCSGDFTLINENDGIYEFQAINKSASCSSEGQDFLQLLSDGKLQYTSRGAYGETLGKLVRSDAAPSTPEVTRRMPVFVDDDGSPDGTSALLFLLVRPDVDIKAAGISYGEAHPAVYIQHVGRMLDHYNYANIPLGAGMDGSLSGNEGFPEWLRQEASTFWGWSIPNAQKTYPVQDDADLIISVVKQSQEPITLFFSGPLTNLALALRKAPEIRENIAALYMMGGAVSVPGNVHDFYPDSANLYAEWNVYADPLAMKDVLEAGLPFYLIPLDATNQVAINRTDTAQWRKGGEIADFAADIYDGLMNSTGKSDFFIWDLLTSVIMLDPALCEFQLLHVEVVTEEADHFGETVVIPDKEPNLNVCVKPNAVLIKQDLVDTFAGSQ